jgi:hypothetical protein
MKTHDINAAVRGLNPFRGDDRITDAAWSQITENVTSEHAAPAVSLEPRRRPARPRLVFAAAGSLLIAGVVAAALVSGPGQDQAQALAFTEQGDKLIVRVVDPKADPARYNAEFKKMGLDITVRTIPVSPPKVGTIAGITGRTESDFKPLHRLEPGEKCNGTLNASDPGCQEGLELPKNYDGQALIDFGRPAKPGEMYLHTSGSATAKGELLAGLVIHNKTVAQVRPQIEARGVKVVSYVSGNAPNLDSRETAPGTWYVYDATSHAPGEVVLFVGAKPEK